ncbi:hypothetical protein E5678_06370 [Hydrogenophaga sp. PAMC20947]|nr:hypothetical protein E5678_06370 [Hydrogenophaga sp. PAMC20947]
METAVPVWSLQSRAQLLVGLALSIGLVLGSVSMYQAAVAQDDQITDARVEMLAKTILQSAVAELDHPHQIESDSAPFKVPPHFAGGSHQYQIWTNNGTTLLASHKAPKTQPLLPVSYTGYREVLIDGTYYCAFSAATEDRTFIVQVAEPTPSRIVPFRWLATEYLALALIPFAAILLFNRFMLRKSFRPIEAVVENLRCRSPDDATPIDAQNTPSEIAPLVQSLNAHLQRMGLALSVQSRFTSAAAHELKTPLAGVRAQAQLAIQAKDPEHVRDALRSVMLGVDASSRIIDQLMDFHHVASFGDPGDWRSEVTSLAKIRQLAWADIQPRAKAKNIKLRMMFDIDEMRGHEFAIWTLLRNLMENAVKYTPANGRIDVRIKQRDLRVVLTVDDSGPGIAAELRHRAMEKFDRLGRRGGDGVGLGLSIVASVASMHQAVLELQDSPLGGLRVLVQFHATDVSDRSGKDEAFLINLKETGWSSNRP